ncbi:MAG: hypothetical protein WCI40_06240, partial [Verrucomicrobiota bacterium]
VEIQEKYGPEVTPSPGKQQLYFLGGAIGWGEGVREAQDVEAPFGNISGILSGTQEIRKKERKGRMPECRVIPSAARNLSNHPSAGLAL